MKPQTAIIDHIIEKRDGYFVAFIYLFLPAGPDGYIRDDIRKYDEIFNEPLSKFWGTKVREGYRLSMKQIYRDSIEDVETAFEFLKSDIKKKLPEIELVNDITKLR